jgi:glycerol-1-phosphate dehydrogenase [NAD(P)+]
VESIQRLWPELRIRLRAWLPTAPALRAVLELAGSPTQPEAIGLSRTRFRQSFARSREIRSRYTCLDLAVECGMLEASLDSLFGSGGFWAAA